MNCGSLYLQSMLGQVQVTSESLHKLTFSWISLTKIKSNNNPNQSFEIKCPLQKINLSILYNIWYMHKFLTNKPKLTWKIQFWHQLPVDITDSKRLNCNGNADCHNSFDEHPRICPKSTIQGLLMHGRQ